MQPVPDNQKSHIIPQQAVVSQPDTTHTSSLFQGHLLQPKGDKAQIHFTNYDYLLALILFVFYVVYVWLYVTNRKRLNQLVKSFYQSRSNTALTRDDYAASNRVAVVLSTLFLFTLSLFLGQVADYYGLFARFDHEIRYLFIAGALILMYLIKFSIVRFAGFIFKTGKEASEYMGTLFLFVNIVGLFMLPVVTCLAFVRQVSPFVFICTGFTIIIGFLAIRLIRGILIGLNSNRVSGFYLFLYLCTLEIVPFVILIKLFMIYR